MASELKLEILESQWHIMIIFNLLICVFARTRHSFKWKKIWDISALKKEFQSVFGVKIKRKGTADEAFFKLHSNIFLLNAIWFLFLVAETFHLQYHVSLIYQAIFTFCCLKNKNSKFNSMIMQTRRANDYNLF